MRGGNLLIIDDEQRLRDNLTMLLSDEGYTVTTATDGRAGVHCLQQSTFDLVITDLKMAGLDGFGVMEYIASHTPDTPVIVITGYASTESAIEALRRGAYDYIAKPFEMELIQMAIARALEKVRLQRQLKQYTAALEQRLVDLRTTAVSKRYVENIIRSLADMLLVVHPDGTIRSINTALTTTLGYTPQELLGQPWRTICQVDIGCAQVGPAPEAPTGHVHHHETVFLARDGRRIPVSCAQSPMYDDEGTLQGSVCIAQDITERKQTEEALRAREAWLRLLTKQMPAVLWATDAHLRPTAFLGTGLACVPPLSHPEGERRRGESCCPAGADFVAMVMHRRALEGESVIQEVQHGARTLHAHVEPLRDAAGSIIGTIGVALDITERKCQEEARRKIAYEIHDGIAQLLVSAQQHLDTFEALWQHDTARAHLQLERGLDRLNRAIVEARRLMAQMRPVALDTQGLMAAVQHCLEDIGTEAGWEVECHTAVEGLILSPDEETAIFRIIQEALSNARKHASTPRVRVEMHLEDAPGHTLAVVIQDWGRGFQPDTLPTTPQHLGLSGMRERAQQLGGTCVIDSHLGQGTTVRVRIPLRRGEAA